MASLKSSDLITILQIASIDGSIDVVLMTVSFCINWCTESIISPSENTDRNTELIPIAKQWTNARRRTIACTHGLNTTLDRLRFSQLWILCRR